MAIAVEVTDRLFTASDGVRVALREYDPLDGTHEHVAVNGPLPVVLTAAQPEILFPELLKAICPATEDVAVITSATPIDGDALANAIVKVGVFFTVETFSVALDVFAAASMALTMYELDPKEDGALPEIVPVVVLSERLPGRGVEGSIEYAVIADPIETGVTVTDEFGVVVTAE